MGKIDNIRNWLKRNKIFFETVGAISLSIMAITVSIGAVLISIYQTNQIELENQPGFLFTMENSPDEHVLLLHDEEMNFSHDYLVIKNEGKPFKNLNIEYLIIAGVWYYSFDKKQNKMTSKSFDIPLHYIANSPRIDSDGNMRIEQILPGYYINSLNGGLLFASFRNYIKPKGDDLWSMSYSRYLKIQYMDIYDKPHTKYFYIYNDGGASEISKEYYEKYTSQVNFNEIPAFFSDYYILSTLQPTSAQSGNINQTIFEPWYNAFKKKFDET